MKQYGEADWRDGKYSALDYYLVGSTLALASLQNWVLNQGKHG